MIKSNVSYLFCKFKQINLFSPLLVTDEYPCLRYQFLSHSPSSFWQYYLFPRSTNPVNYVSQKADVYQGFHCSLNYQANQSISANNSFRRFLLSWTPNNFFALKTLRQAHANESKPPIILTFLGKDIICKNSSLFHNNCLVHSKSLGEKKRKNTTL